MPVNSTTWKKLPQVPRETKYSADDAIARIFSWGGGSAEKLASAFLWRDSRMPISNKNAYRFPIGDIYNSKLTLVPHAVFSAATILSGAHGGLEGVVSEEDRRQLKKVITEIYAQLQQQYGDRRLEAPWLKGRTEQERNAELKAMGISASLLPWLSLWSALSAMEEKTTQLISAQSAKRLTASDASSSKTPNGSTALPVDLNAIKTGSSGQDQQNSFAASSSVTTSNTGNTNSSDAGKCTSNITTESPQTSTTPSSKNREEDVLSAANLTTKESGSQLITTGGGVVSGESFVADATPPSGISTKTQASCEGRPTMQKTTDSASPGKSFGDQGLTAAVNSAGWTSMPIASASQPWNGAAAQSALWEWADGDMRQYRRGFLYWDQSKPDVRGSYKLPIALPADGALTIVPAAVSAVAAVLGGARGGVDIPSADADRIAGIVENIQGRFDDSQTETLNAALFENTGESPRVFPPAAWFSDPKLGGPTPLAVTADGEVVGHGALWRICHSGIGDRCVMAPKSAVDYKFFLNGSVLTAEGSMVRVGKITMGTGHADKTWGYVPAADHYDNTGTTIAITAAGEDRFGIWFHGAVVPGATDSQIQELRRSPISGDWRRINGNLELVAALAVNTPGFPIVSVTASGEIDSLCAAGVLLEDGSMVADATVPLSEPDRDVLATIAKLDKQWDKIRQDARRQTLRTLLSKDVK